MSGSSEASQARQRGREWLGRVLDDRYRLLEVIGSGGMGSVYRAEHVTTRRTLAVKLLHADLAASPELRARFEREAVAIGRIQHPNCVDVSDFGQLADGSMYLVMEYLEGRSLGDLLDEERRLEPVRALRILRHMLRGLGHAHRAEIVHRDMKPDNVLLVQQGGDPEFAKILDFGIAKLLGGEADSTARLTRAGIAFGTPLYISPEQATGSRVDGRSDLYSATVVLFEMLAGRPPFESDDNLELLSLHASRLPPRVGDLVADAVIPEPVEELVARGLAKRPSGRFVDAAAYEEAVTALLVQLAAAEGQPLGRSAGTKGSTVPVLYPAGPTPAPDGAATAPTPLPGGTPTPVPSAPQTPTPLPPSLESTSVRPRGSRMLLGLLAGAAVALALAYWLTRPSEEDKRQAAAEAEAASLATTIDRLVAEGEVEAALVLLEAQRERVADDPATAAHLGTLASTAADYDLRHRALALVRELGLEDRVDHFELHVRDLEHRDLDYHCRHRRRAVEKLRALGDPRAIEPLQQAIERKDSRGRPANECLVEDARAAIEHLRGR
jgi:eukaryotic-like serine/threonine-protein kinase